MPSREHRLKERIPAPVLPPGARSLPPRRVAAAPGPTRMIWSGDVDGVPHRVVRVEDGRLNVRREVDGPAQIEWREVRDPELLARVLGAALLAVSGGWKPRDKPDVIPGKGEDAHVVADDDEADG